MSESSNSMYLFQFCKKNLRKNLIQPPGEPWEHHLGEVWQKKVWATQNFIKDKMIRRVNILWHIFEKSAKKVQNETERNNIVFGKEAGIFGKIDDFLFYSHPQNS